MTKHSDNYGGLSGAHPEAPGDLSGLVMRQFHFAVATLGQGDLLKKRFWRGLLLFDGDLTLFFKRPIPATLSCIVARVIPLRMPTVNRSITVRHA